MNENNLSSDEKVLKLIVIGEKAKFMIGAEYKIREILYNEEFDEEIIHKDIHESKVYIDRWHVLRQKLTQILIVKN